MFSAQRTTQGAREKQIPGLPSWGREQAWESAFSVCIPGYPSAGELRTTFEKAHLVSSQVLSGLERLSSSLLPF